MWTAATVRHDTCVAAGKTHIVGYTEASVGVHLGQAGLLVDLIVGQGKAGAVGVRGAQDMAAMVRLPWGNDTHSAEGGRRKDELYLGVT
jgi:hypothetical protein